MIRPSADRQAEALFHGRHARRLPANIQRVAQRKLRQLHSAEDLRDLAAPPGNRLEALRGSRTGQHSVRINDRWRLCFVWTEGAPSGSRSSTITESDRHVRLTADPSRRTASRGVHEAAWPHRLPAGGGYT